MSLIEIGKRNYLLYLILTHPMKMALLSGDSRARLDRINAGFNDRVYSGAGATEYDRIHVYEGDARHEYPARALVALVWDAAGRGYGDALELRAGSGYFTTLIGAPGALGHRDRAGRGSPERGPGSLRRRAAAQCARRRLARIRPELRRPARIRRLGVHHPEPSPFPSPPGRLRRARSRRASGRTPLSGRAAPQRAACGPTRPEVSSDLSAPRLLGRREQLGDARLPDAGELRALCRHGGFESPRIEAYWIPCSRRLFRSAERRFRVERILGRIPVLRHAGSILAMQARRTA